MKNFERKKPTKSKMVFVRISEDLHSDLNRLNIHISDVCRDALERSVKRLTNK